MSSKFKSLCYKKVRKIEKLLLTKMRYIMLLSYQVISKTNKSFLKLCRLSQEAQDLNLKLSSYWQWKLMKRVRMLKHKVLSVRLDRIFYLLDILSIKSERDRRKVKHPMYLGVFNICKKCYQKI